MLAILLPFNRVKIVRDSQRRVRPSDIHKITHLFGTETSRIIYQTNHHDAFNTSNKGLQNSVSALRHFSSGEVTSDIIALSLSPFEEIDPGSSPIINEGMKQLLTKCTRVIMSIDEFIERLSHIEYRDPNIELHELLHNCGVFGVIGGSNQMFNPQFGMDAYNIYFSLKNTDDVVFNRQISDVAEPYITRDFLRRFDNALRNDARNHQV